MGSSFTSLLLLISGLIFSLLNADAANQGGQLRKLMESERSRSLQQDSQVVSDADQPSEYKPAAVSPQDGLRKADKLSALAGQPEGCNFDQFAGYVTVDPDNGRALFYYFVESPQNASTKPLVLWLSGGSTPGCSSLGVGALQELGPFRVNSDGKTLSRNIYAWNEVANVIFLESPAGVGFSYSNTISDYDLSGDQRTADDAYAFLINWLERFPQYKNRDFFIMGEGYAGHFVPDLAYVILQNNKITNQTIINLRGIALGNALVDRIANDNGANDYLVGHTLITDETYNVIRATCNFALPNQPYPCRVALDRKFNEFWSSNDLNIYAPLCSDSADSDGSSKPYTGGFDPCSEKYVRSYLNHPEAQKALHANVTALPYPWELCSGLQWSDKPDSMLPIIQQVMASGISVWLYSGDLDYSAPITATKLFIAKLGLPIEQSWRPWYSSSEVGGYVVGYKGLTLVTIRGAGHKVPSDQPQRALTMISSFLQGSLPPPQ